MRAWCWPADAGGTVVACAAADWRCVRTRCAVRMCKHCLASPATATRELPPPSPCAAPQHVHAHTVRGHSHTPVACHRTHRACVPNPFPVCGRALRLCASERAHGHNTPPAPDRPTMHASTRRRGSVKWQCAACGESGGSCAGGDVVWPACMRWCVVAVHRRARLRAR